LDENAVEIKSGNFHWGFLDEETAHKKLLEARKKSKAVENIPQPSNVS